jgi:putative phosphoesterase
MKLAILGDIHSNHTALEQCLDHALDRNVDEFLFLGDYVTDCPYPQKTMQMIYDMQKNHRCYFIRGNREDYMLNHREHPEERWTYSSASGCLLYTYKNLTQQDLDFYKKLPIHDIYRKKGYTEFRYCHGSLTSSKELLLPDNPNMETIMQNLDVDLLISGHTHIQESRIYGEKKLIHPGSVGLPWYQGGKTEYMILHSSEKSPFGWEEELFQIPYDLNKVKKEIETSGLTEKAPFWVKLIMHCMETGDDYMVPCLQLATKLCKEAEGTAIWPDIPEKYWEEAYEQVVTGNKKEG